MIRMLHGQRQGLGDCHPRFYPGRSPRLQPALGTTGSGSGKNKMSPAIDIMVVWCYTWPLEGGPMVRMTLRVPDKLHEKLRWLAFQTRRSQHSIIIEQLEKVLKDVQAPREKS